MNRRNCLRSVRLRAALVVSSLLVAAGCSSESKDGLPVGLLLPRTGQLADSGGHAETAALMAAEQVNRAGGVAGQPLMLVLKDTRSDASDGRRAAEALLEGSVRGVIGPEEEAVAAALVPMARDRGIVQVSGGVSSPRFTTIADGGLFYRTCPSATVTASALAQRMAEDGVTRASFIFVPNDFGTAFIGSAAIAFSGKGGQIVSAGNPVPVSVEPGKSNYRGMLAELLSMKPEALMLATDPITGAQLISDWKLLGGTGRLYLAPTLMTDVFVKAVPAGALESAVGVSAISGGQSDGFAEAYEAFSGEAPAQSAYFYFDAMALLALALEHAKLASGGEPTGEQVRAALDAVASPPGEKVGWDGLAHALELVRAGNDIDYVGASGAVDFDRNGDVQLEQVRFWAVRASAIVVEVE